MKRSHPKSKSRYTKAFNPNISRSRRNEDDRLRYQINREKRNHDEAVRRIPTAVIVPFLAHLPNTEFKQPSLKSVHSNRPYPRTSNQNHEGIKVHHLMYMLLVVGALPALVEAKETTNGMSLHGLYDMDETALFCIEDESQQDAQITHKNEIKTDRDENHLITKRIIVESRTATDSPESFWQHSMQTMDKTSVVSYLNKALKSLRDIDIPAPTSELLHYLNNNDLLSDDMLNKIESKWPNTIFFQFIAELIDQHGEHQPNKVIHGISAARRNLLDDINLVSSSGQVESLLHHALRRGSDIKIITHIIDRLDTYQLKMLCELNIRQLNDSPDQAPKRPLLLALKYGSFEVIEKILSTYLKLEISFNKKEYFAVKNFIKYFGNELSPDLLKSINGSLKSELWKLLLIPVLSSLAGMLAVLIYERYRNDDNEQPVIPRFDITPNDRRRAAINKFREAVRSRYTNNSTYSAESSLAKYIDESADDRARPVCKGPISHSLIFPVALAVSDGHSYQPTEAFLNHILQRGISPMTTQLFEVDHAPRLNINLMSYIAHWLINDINSNSELAPRKKWKLIDQVKKIIEKYHLHDNEFDSLHDRDTGALLTNPAIDCQGVSYQENTQHTCQGAGPGIFCTNTHYHNYNIQSICDDEKKRSNNDDAQINMNLKKHSI